METWKHDKYSPLKIASRVPASATAQAGFVARPWPWVLLWRGNILNFIPVDPHIERNKKIRRLARMTGFTLFETWPRVVKLWMYAFINEPDGNVTSLNDDAFMLCDIFEIENQGKALEFFKAMKDAELIDDQDGRLEIHDWFEDGAGKLHLSRRRARDRKAKQRNVTGTSQGQAKHDITEQDSTLQNTTFAPPEAGDASSDVAKTPPSEAAAEDPVLSVLRKETSFQSITEWSGVNDLRWIVKSGKAYPYLDLIDEIRRADVYIVANPKKRPKEPKRFLTNWFSRSDERRRRNERPVNTNVFDPNGPDPDAAKYDRDVEPEDM